MQIKVKKLREDAKLPVYASLAAAGADLFACTDRQIHIQPGETAFIPTGLAMELPQGYAGFVYARSGLACKQDLAPANKVGVIDSDYRGELMVALHNHGSQRRTVISGDRIAQLVIAPVIMAEFVPQTELTDTQRASGGFGSTGK